MHFDGALLADAFRRIDSDPAFRARRGPVVRGGQRLLRATGLLALLERLPPRWATPMAFSCRRASG